MLLAYCIDGPKKGQYIASQHEKFSIKCVNIKPQFSYRDLNSTYMDDYVQTVEYKAHKWSYDTSRTVRNLKGYLHFSRETYIATCNAVQPPEILPEDIVQQLQTKARKLRVMGDFLKDFDQWFIETAWKHGMVIEEDLL